MQSQRSINTSQGFNSKRFLRALREKGKALPGLSDSIVYLQEEASKDGLNNNSIAVIMDILKTQNLAARSSMALIKCMIPIGKLEDAQVKSFVAWFLSVPIAKITLNVTIQWFIGCLEYQLIDRNSLYIFYDPFFYLMLEQESLQKRLAQLLYLLTKPEDVTRRQVLRLLKETGKSQKIQKHLTALLSLFKSYKPEVVPEKIPAINVQSTWTPILEIIRVGFADARERILLGNARNEDEVKCDWTTTNPLGTKKKKQQPLLPSIGYFNIGSSIFKDKIEKSIFDVTTATDLGKYEGIIEKPCNATSLLSNFIGYHLLTYADFDYQQKFIYNLYYTFWRSFIFENGRYSSQEMSNILNLTVEFSRYMQRGIPIVNHFMHEYLSCYGDEYTSNFLSLMEWSSVSAQELQDTVLSHLKLLYYNSSVELKCKIIRTLRNLLTNLSVINHDSFKGKTFPFLQQTSSTNFTSEIHIIEKFTKELMTSGINIHAYDSLLISEAQSFYEQMDAIQIYQKTSYMAPPALIYGSIVNKSCALLSRTCALLLQYRRSIKILKEHKNTAHFNTHLKWMLVYVEDLGSALWFDNVFKNRSNPKRYFLKTLNSEAVSKELVNKMDVLLNIMHHYAFLPYIIILSLSGVNVKTKDQAKSIAAEYYHYIDDFISKVQLGN